MNEIKKETPGIADWQVGENENKVSVVHSGEKSPDESQQFQELLKVCSGREQALGIFTQIKKLENGEFKDSQLRNAEGELLIVWHGSPRKFRQFSTDTKGEYRWRNRGVHFQSSRQIIEQYSEKAYSAIRTILADIAGKLFTLESGKELTPEQLEKLKQTYNQIIEDLIINGEESVYYKKGYSENQPGLKVRNPSLDAITYQGRTFGTEWALEIFNGEMPTRENSYLDPVEGVYLGNGIGKYEYAAVLNIKNPYKPEASTNIDHDFEQGEQAQEGQGTDGTILHHQKDLIGDGGLPIKGTKGTYSAAIFEASQIKVLGRMEHGKFVTDL